MVDSIFGFAEADTVVASGLRSGAAHSMVASGLLSPQCLEISVPTLSTCPLEVWHGSSSPAQRSGTSVLVVGEIFGFAVVGIAIIVLCP